MLGRAAGRQGSVRTAARASGTTPTPRLPLLQAALPGCEPLPRYRALLAFCEARPAGFGEHAAWLRRALAALEPPASGAPGSGATAATVGAPASAGSGGGTGRKGSKRPRDSEDEGEGDSEGEEDELPPLAARLAARKATSGGGAPRPRRSPSG
jgi:hypothetical protein